MNIHIICIGKIKEKSFKDIILEYEKRLSKFVKIYTHELLEDKTIDLECDKILQKIEKISNPYIFTLDVNSNQYNSIEFANKIKNVMTYNTSNLVFVIGGSDGLNKKIKEKSNDLVSFSKMTFPHQLIRIFLIEQIYRAFKINNNETYHK